jgi:hypothetical protein
MVTSLVTEDTEKFGVGPWDLDIAMARRLGYNEAEIRVMCDKLANISRDFNRLLEGRTNVTNQLTRIQNRQR